MPQPAHSFLSKQCFSYFRQPLKDDIGSLLTCMLFNMRISDLELFSIIIFGTLVNLVGIKCITYIPHQLLKHFTSDEGFNCTALHAPNIQT